MQKKGKTNNNSSSNNKIKGKKIIPTNWTNERWTAHIERNHCWRRRIRWRRRQRSRRRHVYSIQMNMKFTCCCCRCLLLAISLSMWFFVSSFCFVSLYFIRMSLSAHCLCVLSSHLMPLVHFIMRKEEIERVCTIVRPRCVIDNYNSKQQQWQQQPQQQQWEWDLECLYFFRCCCISAAF